MQLISVTEFLGMFINMQVNTRTVSRMVFWNAFICVTSSTCGRIWRCVYRASYCNVLMTNEMHISYNQFLFHSFLSTLHVSKESSRPSSGARHNILYYTVWYCRYNRAGESSCFEAARLTCTIVPIVPNCVIQYIMPCSWWWTARFVRNM